MVISVKEIQDLRALTGAGMMNCKEALINAGGDVDKAIIYLRKKGLADIKDRSVKKTSEGTIGYYIHAGGKIGAMVEINCETDFTSKSAEFREFAQNLAMHIAATNPKWLSGGDVPDQNITNEMAVFEEGLGGKPKEIINKIIKGKLEKFFKEVCLVNQAFIKDSNLTITDLLGDLASKVGEKIVIKRFTRFVIGGMT